MALQNKYHLRTVAENSGKPCWVDYKITTSVLITPDNKDFFYVCKGHLKDRSFCIPSVPVEDAAAAAAKKREADLQTEIESLKKEYSAKQAQKKEKTKDESKDESKNEAKDKAAEEKSDVKANDESQDSDGKSKAGVGGSATDDLPRIYSLHRNFFQMRLDRIRTAEQARRNRERMKDPNFFPSVPSSGTPGA